MTDSANVQAAALFLFGALAACGTAVAPVAAPDVAADVTVLPGFGEACSGGGECAAGLSCQDSEYAPFPWCTRSCPTAKEPCDKNLLGGWGGLCIQMPSGWRGPAEPFCAPTCGNSSQCTPLDKRWETCALPGYKKKALYGDVGKVCQAPSANGQVKVDPVTCDWQSLVTEPTVQDLKGICASFCTFLSTCQVKDKAQSTNCCTWQCFQFLAPGGVRDMGRVNDFQCYLKSFDANAQNPNVCTAFVGDCGPLCKDDAGCGDGDACTTDSCADWKCLHTAIEGCH